MTSFCLGYLNLACFDQQLSTQEIRDYYLKDWYAFQEYAIAHWIDHLGGALHVSANPKNSDLDKLMIDIEDHLTRFSEGRISTNEEKQLNPMTKHRIHAQHAFLIQGKNKKDQQNTTYKSKILEQLRVRRQVMENTIGEVGADVDPLQIYYGPSGKWFKCMKIYCLGFCEGFQSQKVRDLHHQRHTRSFRCGVTSCPMHRLGFTSPALLKKHAREHHPTAEEEDFPIPITPQETNRNIRHGQLIPGVPVRYSAHAKLSRREELSQRGISSTSDNYVELFDGTLNVSHDFPGFQNHKLPEALQELHPSIIRSLDWRDWSEQYPALRGFNWSEQLPNNSAQIGPEQELKHRLPTPLGALISNAGGAVLII